ncbi:Ribosomal RNA large subunit methyltransferase E [Fundidesulfovibrio magnetotacticus]|uniref:Ribosomal RNA large subunit methyltransferase E n=1 Tax=Fundidesulfovibrio magnetotacticus TaxID=2730080 RepID=A0A6V8LRG9_9BACT|nr:RlmE family RNA methyltransferase [Fundidesulfovibrio magnetotacticus]GFK95082.1 Ribosomal RNA large subunit methyltransferase E [Fundidesulfovibrio magnetotacticus]
MKKLHDHYFHRAKQENYPARSVYKLQEMDASFKLLRPGLKVLDLGAAPGSWTLYAAKKVGPSGRVLGVDLQATDTAFPENATFLQADAFDPGPEFAAHLERLAPVDLVISDMAPRTTGQRVTDQARSLELVEQALALAGSCLIHGGHFVAKVFMGPDVKAFTDSMRGAFEKVKTAKPKSSRPESFEQFIIGLGFKGLPHHAEE